MGVMIYIEVNGLVHVVTRVKHDLATREKERRNMTKTAQKIRGRMEAYCKVFTLFIKLFNINRRTVIN